MLLSLGSAHFRFTYTFESGHKLVGFVEGDRSQMNPDLVFNLRSLKAICLDPQGSPLMNFDTTFGQLNTSKPEVILSGSLTGQGSFFSLNYRGADASVYNAVTDTWIASGWDPQMWKVEELTVPRSKTAISSAANLAWMAQAIA
ncbi:MAG: hypothetical protein F6K42_21350 [Leptolyngbya sp. SIO1D8]|nr:hypothetical protein [Leptolyngbya sp. SIO1D8]